MALVPLTTGSLGQARPPRQDSNWWDNEAKCLARTNIGGDWDIPQRSGWDIREGIHKAVGRLVVWVEGALTP